MNFCNWEDGLTWSTFYYYWDDEELGLSEWNLLDYSNGVLKDYVKVWFWFLSAGKLLPITVYDKYVSAVWEVFALCFKVVTGLLVL